LNIATIIATPTTNRRPIGITPMAYRIMPTTTARAKAAAGFIFPTDVAKKKVITAVIIDVTATVELSTFIGTIGTAISSQLIDT
jgi:hypothetical protein